MTNEQQAKRLLSCIRIGDASEGPMYGAVKATAANAFALLAVVERLDALLEKESEQ